MSSGPPRAIKNLATLDLNLETARLKLIPLAERHVDAMWPVVSDPEFPKLMSWAAHTSRDETVAYVRHTAEAIIKGTDVAWAIEQGGAFAGCVGLHGIEWQSRAWRCDRAEIGYWIMPALHARGIATEAALAAMKFAFETLGLNKLTIGCLAENAGSKRVIEKCGFRYLARHEDDVWRDGRWWAHLRYELLFSEWSDISSTLRFSRRPLQP